MRFKRLLALLLAAALALSLLAGCGGGKNQSLSQMLLNLLDGQYQNVSVEIDSDLEAKLRQAISESETDEELRAALEQLLGGGISFQRLGSGQQGDSAWTLIIYPGTDPDAAARSVYLDLDKVFAALPDDGVYSSGFAMVEMENGYAILVRATVDRAGTEDKPDPVTLESIKVTKNPKLEYWVGEPFDPANMVITATYSNNTTKTLKDIKQSGDQGVTWTPDGALTTEGTHDITISYGGKTTTVSVTVKEPEVDSLTVEPSSLTYTAGDYFTPTDIKGVTVIYSENIKTETITSGYTITDENQKTVDEKYRFMTAGNYTLTVSYKGGTGTVNIKVNPATVTGIDVTWPNKTYYQEDTLSKSDVTVKAKYSNDVQSRVSDFLLTIKGPGDAASTEITDEKPYKFDTADEYTLTVTYTDNGVTKTDETTIEVADKGYEIEGSTYKVSNTHGLQAWNEAVQKDMTLNCTLTADITLPTVSEGESNWTPIGSGFSSNTGYQGTFNGGGHTITGLSITTNSTDGGNAVLFDGIGSNGTVKNLQVAVNYNVQQGVASGIVNVNYGTITACSVTGDIAARTSDIGGIASINNGSIIGCWFDGNLTTIYAKGGIAAYNYGYGSVTACFYGGNAGQGVYNNEGGTVDATKVNDGDSWQTAVDGMNAALTGNDYQWKLGENRLPVLQRNQ